MALPLADPSDANWAVDRNFQVQMVRAQVNGLREDWVVQGLPTGLGHGTADDQGILQRNQVGHLLLFLQFSFPWC